MKTKSYQTHHGHRDQGPTRSKTKPRTNKHLSRAVDGSKLMTIVALTILLIYGIALNIEPIYRFFVDAFNSRIVVVYRK